MALTLIFYLGASFPKSSVVRGKGASHACYDHPFGTIHWLVHSVSATAFYFSLVVINLGFPNKVSEDFFSFLVNYNMISKKGLSRKQKSSQTEYLRRV